MFGPPHAAGREPLLSWPITAAEIEWHRAVHGFVMFCDVLCIAYIVNIVEVCVCCTVCLLYLQTMLQRSVKNADNLLEICDRRTSRMFQRSALGVKCCAGSIEHQIRGDFDPHKR